MTMALIIYHPNSLELAPSVRSVKINPCQAALEWPIHPGDNVIMSSGST